MVRILPNMGSGKWLVYIWRLMATVALGLGQFGRFLPCDLGIGLPTCDLGLELPSNYYACSFPVFLRKRR